MTTLPFRSFHITDLIIIFFWITFTLVAQENVPTKAKKYRPPAPRAFIDPYDITTERLWEGFQLIQKANSGDAISQHELGIRYFLGKGFPFDTASAAFWTKKAADQNLAIAQYNYGIFLNNGWGTAWNPFEAYKYFKSAADQKMPDALYVLGLIYTDNLIVERDWKKAYSLIKSAAKQDYAPAKEVLAEMERRGLGTEPDSTQESPLSKQTPSQKKQQNLTNWQPILMDFTEDNSKPNDDLNHLVELLQNNAEIRKAIGMSTKSNSTDSLRGISLLQFSANAGSPEACLLLGRCYEKGIQTEKNIMHAAFFYVRAVRLESQHAPEITQAFIQQKDFFKILKERVKKNDVEAMYIWSMLTVEQLDFQLTKLQAEQFLRKGCDAEHQFSMLELGTWYFGTELIQKDREKALELWTHASLLGNREATTRLAAFQIFNNIATQLDSSLKVLQESINDGSVLAQVALARSYEKGLGIQKNIALAVHNYRESAQRGNQLAMQSLKALYDEIRPIDKEFHVEE